MQIAENVAVSQMSFTVTNVTLRPDAGYVVNFVNPSNATDVYASSSTFTVEPQNCKQSVALLLHYNPDP